MFVDRLINRAIFGHSFGAVTVVGGGKKEEVVADWHVTKDPKEIELGGIPAIIQIDKHDGFQAVGKVTLTQGDEAGKTQQFSLQKGQSVAISSDLSVVHEHRRK